MPEDKPRKTAEKEGSAAPTEPKARSAKPAPDQTQTNTPLKTGRTGVAAREEGLSGEAVATEKPVFSAAPPITTEYVVTVDNRTGTATKIEKLSAGSDERKELSEEEYARLFPYVRRPAKTKAPGLMKSTSGSGIATVTQAAPASQSNALADAYYRGVNDYIQAFLTQW